MCDATGSAEGRQRETFFAPAGRLGRGEVREMSELVRENPLVGVLLEAVNGFVIVLNRERQILAANMKVLEALQLTCTETVAGFRPGEAFGCIHADTGPGGCGTAGICSACGCVRTVLSCQESGAPAEGECLLSMRHGDDLASAEFMVRATPISIHGHALVVAVLNDISDTKRRRTLERVLIHDLSNTIGALLGWSELAGHRDQQFVAEQITAITKQLTAEFNAMRLLIEAERGGLDTRPIDVAVPEVFDGLRQLFRRHRTAQEKELIVFCGVDTPRLHTDPRLLNHVLVNMTKNALEATPEGGKVRVWTEAGDGNVEFIVSNPGEMPEHVSRQIFQRTFTTKEDGMGLGTYSMKLFGEQYLGGEVSFDTSRENGTRFRLRLPLEMTGRG